MSFNTNLAERLETIARLLEVTGANRFRVNAFTKAARSASNETHDLSTLDREALLAIDGIGKGVADKIDELRDSGGIAELDELLAEVPAGVLDLMDIPGLGPKTVRLLWQEKSITDRDGLKRIIDDGSIMDLPRMGKKTAENIEKALTFTSKSSSRLPIGVAWPIAERVLETLRSIEGVRRAEAAGSLRRGQETIGDLDFLVVADDPEPVREAFCTMEGVTDVVARGDSKCSVRSTITADSGRWNVTKDLEGGGLGMDLRLVPAESFGAALMYFTGSKDHNVRLRERAIKRGLTLNEYGLFPDEPGEGSPQSRGIDPVAGETEGAVFAELEMPWLPPEVRQDAGELSLNETPQLVDVGDIRAELHAHTTASDGRLSLDELVRGAVDRGFHTIAVTDHSRSSVQANGLSVERLRAQRDEIEAARERSGDGIAIMAGSEVDILADGSLDYDDDILAELDVVVASPHAALTQDPKTATKRLLKAIEHPMVHVLGHPTGRLVNRRPGLEPAMDELIAAAVEHRVALEINSHWMRLDLRDSHVRAAVDAGCLIAIDCDVHAAGDFDNIRFGVMTGRRGWLPPELCVNTWDRDRLHEWLRSKGRG
ncbi:MAG: DNA polymerase/3'-5' exonuclease PolX [Planctomycetota bacterium]